MQDVPPRPSHDGQVRLAYRHEVEAIGEIKEGGEEEQAARQEAGDGGAVQPERRNRPEPEDEDRVEQDVEDRAANHELAGEARVARRAHRRRGDHAQHDEGNGEVDDGHEATNRRQQVFGRAESAEQRIDGQYPGDRANAGDQERQDQAVGRKAFRAFMIVGAQRPRDDGRRAGAETDRDARDDHEYREAEAKRRERTIADDAEEIGVDERLRHERRDADQHGQGHVDEVPSDRSLGKPCAARCHAGRIQALAREHKQNSVQHPGRHDVAQRSARFQRVEGIAGHERQHRQPCVENQAATARIHDIDAYHLVQVTLPANRLDADEFAGHEIAQERKMRIAMAGNDGVTDFAGQGTRTKVPGAKRKRSSRAAGQHDQVDVARLDRQPRDGPGVGPWPGRGPVLARGHAQPRALHELLREPRFRRDIGALAEVPESECEQCGHDQLAGPSDGAHDSSPAALCAPGRSATGRTAARPHP